MTTEDEARALIAELAKHQRRGVGMTGSSPDACACGERILPEPTKGWDDYSDIMDRRDKAFAAHQAQIISALLASRVSTPPSEEWEYGREYYDFDGTPRRRKVSKADFEAHAPDGHRSDGSPYWNYTRYVVASISGSPFLLFPSHPQNPNGPRDMSAKGGRGDGR